MLTREPPGLSSGFWRSDLLRRKGFPDTNLKNYLYIRVWTDAEYPHQVEEKQSKGLATCPDLLFASYLEVHMRDLLSGAYPGVQSLNLFVT